MSDEGRIRALVIDDSVFSRRTITRVLESSPLVEVVGTAHDGEDALALIFDLEPDVITLDLEMPRMDGFTFLRLVVLGASTGGPAALMQIFRAFSQVPPCAFLVAQHMPAGFTAGFAECLDRITCLRVAEARGGEQLEPGTLLVAPGGQHLELQSVDGRVVTRVDASQERDKYAPSVDRLFESASKQLANDLLAVVLTGMGDDGRQGACAVQAAGGRVIAESEDTAMIFGMPQQAIRAGAVDQVLPLGAIAAAIRMDPDGSRGSGRAAASRRLRR